MLPSELAKSDTEHAHQRAFFQWLNFASRFGFEGAYMVSLGGNATLHDKSKALPELALMHAIPNGGYRLKSEASKLKAEGVKPGVPDTFLPVPKAYAVPNSSVEAWYCGLYIEFKEPKRKTQKNGGVSLEQDKFMEGARDQGYCTRVAYTWAEAANLVMLYYGVDTRFDT